jgi:RHS repeat-associated protein
MCAGWETTEARTINGVTKNIVTQDNFDGSVATEVYPSGRTVTYTPGSAGRALAAKDVANNINYVTAATYAPQGALAGFSNGSSVSGAVTYNSRLQPLQLYFTTGTISSGTLTQLQQTACPTTAAAIMSRSYNFGWGTNDNRNVISITNCRDTNRTQNFDYDNLNRIVDAYTSGPNWGEAFTIDAWGNLTNKGPYLNKTWYEGLNAAPATTQNQLSGYAYDAAGNMTLTGYTYDAENRLATAGGVTYTYDGAGNRVQKSSGTLYWGAGPLAESDLTASATSWKEYVFFNGKRVARRDASDNSVHYFFSDHLGSMSVITNSTGATLEEDLDYYPYGGTASGSSSDHYLFTGKERDSETGLDNFGARYDSSALGRFMTTDPVVITTERLMNPQQLNLYAYVANNPLRFIDPTGEILQCVGNAESQKQCFSDLQQIAGDAANRLSMDAKTGVVSFDTKDLDLGKNAGAALVNDLVGSKNTYDFSVGPTIMTDKGPVRIDKISTNMANLPTFGDQPKIGNPPSGVSDILGLNLNNPNMTRVSNTNLKVAPEWTVAFHELAEAYEKIDSGKGGSYSAGHNAALQRELELRDQRPYLKGYNTGAGGPANSPNPEGGIIIKK